MKALLLKIGILLLTFIAPIQAALIAVFVLVLSDLVLGILVARKNKVIISSNVARRTFAKLCAYCGGILLSYIAESQLIGSNVVVHATSALAAFIELSSCLQNLSILTGVDLGSIVSKLVPPPPPPGPPK